MNKSAINLILCNQRKENGNLYLGSIHSLDFIKKFKIGAVISLMTEFTPKIDNVVLLLLITETFESCLRRHAEGLNMSGV